MARLHGDSGVTGDLAECGGPIGRASGARQLGAWLAVLLAALVISLPRTPHAGPLSAENAAGYGLEAERSQLQANRQLTAHRSARRADLAGSVRGLSLEIRDLRQRAEQASSAIAEHQDAVRRQEEADDRIVPRLVARVSDLEQRRAEAARALADLASLSRRREVAPALRARLHAIGPALLAVVRSQDPVRATLATQHDRVAAMRQRSTDRLPSLHAEVAQAQDRRQQLLEQRRRALQEIAQLDASLLQLARAHAPLARRVAMIDAAHHARAEPQVAQPAHDGVEMHFAGAAVGDRSVRLQEPMHAAPSGAARVAAATGERLRTGRAPRTEPNLAVRLEALPAARAAGGERVATAAPSAPVPAGMTAGGLSSRVAPAQLALPAPIRPSPEVVMARFGEAGRRMDTALAAMPGQRVAAPQEGRIVFADSFKSYGLLLIIEHDSEYHTLLWGFSKLRVGVGDKVLDGEIIGVMDVVDGVRPRLGVEFRRRGRPVNPLPWLAASSSKVRG